MPGRREIVPLEEANMGTGPDGMVSSSLLNPGTTWLWTILRWCHPVTTLILLVVTIILFVQLQYVSYQVGQEEARVDHLLDQVANQQQGQIQELSQKVEENHSLTLYQMAGTFTLLTGLLTMFHMTTHLRNFHEPFVQRKIVAILWMSPIYGTTSFCSLVFPAADGYLAVIRDFYEAYVVYTFLSFLIAVLGRGDRGTVVDVLAKHADHLEPPMRLLSRCYHPTLTDSPNHAKANAVLTECQILCLQFVLVRPLTSIASFVSTTLMEVHSQQDDAYSSSRAAYFKSPNFFIAMVTNVSVFLAFTGLLKFYHAVRDDLAWCQPFSKFMAIKGIVFLTFWQYLLITIFVNLHQSGQWGGDGDGDDDGAGINVVASNSTESSTSSISSGTTSDRTVREQAAEIQNILICLEMLFFSIAHWCVFPAEEWEPGYRPKTYSKPGIGLSDFVSDVGYIMSSRSESAARRKQSSSVRTDDTIVADETFGALSSLSLSENQSAVEAVPESLERDEEQGAVAFQRQYTDGKIQ
jgi:hypothetical protein